MIWKINGVATLALSTLRASQLFEKRCGRASKIVYEIMVKLVLMVGTHRFATPKGRE